MSIALELSTLIAGFQAKHQDAIAALQAENAALKTQVADYVAAGNVVDELRRKVILDLRAENEALKTQVVALDALVSARAVAAEQQAYDGLLCLGGGGGSVLAEEAQAAAAAAQEAEEEVVDLTGDSESEDAPAAKKPRADARVFSKLAAVLPEGTPLSLTGTGDRWDGAYTKGGLIFQDKAFKSPLAVTKVWSERITERHPKVTKPGSGWVWLKIENGAYKGKTLAQAYDAHYSA
jgi:hypothetical protein